MRNFYSEIEMEAVDLDKLKGKSISITLFLSEYTGKFVKGHSLTWSKK